MLRMITLNYAAGFFDGKRGTFNCGGTRKIGADFKCFLRRAADSPQRTRTLDNFHCKVKIHKNRACRESPDCEVSTRENATDRGSHTQKFTPMNDDAVDKAVGQGRKSAASGL